MDRTDQNLDAGIADTQSVMGRLEQKATIFSAINTALLIVPASLGLGSCPTPVVLLAGISITIVVAALTQGLLAIRPFLGGSDRSSFPWWAEAEPAELDATLAMDNRKAQLVNLPKICMGKMVKLQRCSDWTIAAFVALAVTVIARAAL
jgi:hypothetical protein